MKRPIQPNLQCINDLICVCQLEYYWPDIIALYSRLLAII